MEWRSVAGIPGYEINRQGAVRNVFTGRAIKHQARANNNYAPYVGIGDVCRQVNVLLDETFGSGAAVAAGLPAPHWNRVRVTRAPRRLKGEFLRAGDVPLGELERDTKRRCHSCGKPTWNYRCERCWKKVRGFGSAEAWRHSVAARL